MPEITTLFEDVFRCPYCGTIIGKLAMESLVNRAMTDPVAVQHESVSEVAKCPTCKNYSGLDED